MYWPSTMCEAVLLSPGDLTQIDQALCVVICYVCASG